MPNAITGGGTEVAAARRQAMIVGKQDSWPDDTRDPRHVLYVGAGLPDQLYCLRLNSSLYFAGFVTTLFSAHEGLI